MSLPLIPSPLDALRHRPFSFYPAILNIAHNEWQYRKSTWSDVLVMNMRTSQEVWIPRRFLGEISAIEDPVVIVGLVQELEYKEAAVWPYQRRVIEMPMAVGAPRPPRSPARRNGPAPVVGIRLESSADSQIFRLVGGALLVGILAAYIAVNLYRPAKDQSYRRLTATDDYDAVVRKLGEPWLERRQNSSGELQYRALAYPERGYTVLLLADHGKPALYIGTLDSHWNPLHAVDPRVRGLRRF